MSVTVDKRLKAEGVRVPTPFFLPVFFLMIVVMVPAVIGYSEYIDYDGWLPEGSWAETGSASYDSVTTSDDSISSPVLTPLTDDLDGDGSIEIVVARDGGFRIFTNTEGVLDTIDSYLVSGGLNGEINSFILFDIDDDGLTEIVASDLQEIYIIEYNGTDTVMQNNFNFYTSNRLSMLQCKQAESCILFWVSNTAPSTGTTYVYADTFDSDGIIESDKVIKSVSGSGALPAYKGFCFPTLRHIEVEDIDNDDGEDEYIFNFIEIGIGSSGYAQDRIHVMAVRTNVSNHVVNNNATSWDIYDIWSYPAGRSCDYGKNVEAMFSPPLVLQVSGGDSSSKDIVVAHNVDDDDYKIFVYEYRTATQLEDYPDTQNQEGVIISNVFRADVFPDTGIGCSNEELEDFCVMGYNDNDNIVKALCGSGESSEDHSFFTGTREFYLDLDDYSGYNFSISHGRGEYYRSVHASQQITEYVSDDDACDGTGEFNPSEFYTPYGLLKLKTDTWDDNPMLSDNDCDLEIGYNMPGEEGVMIGVPTKGSVNAPDILYLTDDSLYLYDNGEFNHRGYFSFVSIDPCVEDNGSLTTWKSGTDASIQIVGDDQENDMVSSRAILYYGQEEPLSENLIEYEALVDEPSTDGILDFAPYMLGTDGTAGANMSLMIRDLRETGYIDGLEFRANSTGGVPGDRNILYDVYICPSSSFEFAEDDDAFARCSSTAVKVADDFNLSQAVIGGAPVDVYIPFDEPYSPDYEYDYHVVNFIFGGDDVLNGRVFIPSDWSVSVNLSKRCDSSGCLAFTRLVDINLTNSYKRNREMVSDWTSYVETGVPMTHDFENVDYQIPLADIRVEIRDEENPDSIRFQTYDFSVQSTGQEQGDCVSLFRYDDPDAPAEEEEEDFDPEDSSITTGLDSLNEVLGFNLSRGVFWFVLMIVGSVSIWFAGWKARADMTLTGVVILGLNVLMFVLGAFLGYISIGVIIILSVIGAGGIAIIVGRFFTGAGGG